LTMIASGSLTVRVRHAAEVLAQRSRVKTRIVQVFSVSDAYRMSKSQRNSILKPDLPAMSVHNAPAPVLGRLLPAGSITLGLRDYGLAGEPVSALYDHAGLALEDIVNAAHATLELHRPDQPRGATRSTSH
jgi:transketolase